MLLSPSQLAEFDSAGFIVLRDLLGAAERRRLQEGVLGEYQRQHGFDADTDSTLAPRKYSLTEASMPVADVNFIVDHAELVAAIDQVLRATARVMSFVFYLKPPGSAGTVGDYQHTHDGAHCDYKPFRPVGASLNWVFAIIPLVDYTPDIGPLTVSPGSHQLTSLRPGGRVTKVDRATADQLGPFLDPKLKAGDVLLMHGFMWHAAPPNRSNRLRYGLYSKYMAADAPPGCGPYLFTDEAWRVLADQGRRADLLAHHSDSLVADTRLMIERHGQALLIEEKDGRWGLPGAAGQTERKHPATDSDNVIGHLEEALPTQIGGAPQWMSYAGDYALMESAGRSQLSRVYAYPDEEDPWVDAHVRANSRSGRRHRWMSPDQLAASIAAGDVREPFAAEALDNWLSEGLLRGVGQSSPTAHRTPA